MAIKGVLFTSKLVFMSNLIRSLVSCGDSRLAIKATNVMAVTSDPTFADGISCKAFRIIRLQMAKIRPRKRGFRQNGSSEIKDSNYGHLRFRIWPFRTKAQTTRRMEIGSEDLVGMCNLNRFAEPNILSGAPACLSACRQHILARTTRNKDPRRFMKKFVALVSMVCLATFSWAATAKEEAADRLQKSAEVLTQIAQAPDKGIPEEVLSHAKCIAIVPHLVKGGFVFGGKHGRGVATCRTADGWSAPAFISVGGGSWGLQIGVEGVDLVMLVMNNKGMQHLLSSKFQLSGEGSAAAGPVGRHASAGTDWKMNAELLTYSRSKGVFAGLTLEGAVVEPDQDSTIAIYGKDAKY